ncbi:MAG: hypothetical protein ACSLE0_23105 [Chitinophagaceae bacterium]
MKSESDIKPALVFIMPYPVTILFESSTGRKSTQDYSEQNIESKPFHIENLQVEKFIQGNSKEGSTKLTG